MIVKLPKEKNFKETEIGNIPEDWKIEKLKNLCAKIGSGATPRGGASIYVPSGITLIRSQNVYDDGFNKQGLAFINEDAAEKLNNVEVKEHDILLNITGDSICRASIVPKEILPARVNQHVSILRTNEKLYHKFLFYYLSLNKTKNKLLSFDAGGTRQAITKGMLEEFLVPLPEFKEQIKIGDFFWTISDKIALNRSMNSTLEAIGQALFARWFVDFEFPDEGGKPYRSSGGEMVKTELGGVPRGWRVGTLGDICEITMGQSPPGETYNELGNGLPFYQGISDFGFRFPSRRVYCTSPTRFAEEGDVLLSVRAPVGSLNVAEERCAIGRGVAALRLKGKQQGYLYYLLKATQSGWNKFEAEGTVFGSVSKSGVHEFGIILPPDVLLYRFGSLIEPFDKQIATNEKQSRNLNAIRDALLPKLMSGEIRIK